MAALGNHLYFHFTYRRLLLLCWFILHTNRVLQNMNLIYQSHIAPVSVTTHILSSHNVLNFQHEYNRNAWKPIQLYQYFSMCVTDVVMLRHKVYGPMFATRWARTRHLWLAKCDHYQLRQRKACSLLTRVACYVLKEWFWPIHTCYMCIYIFSYRHLVTVTSAVVSSRDTTHRKKDKWI